MSAIRSLAAFEARTLLRGPGTLAGLAAFAVTSLAVTLLGLASFRQLGLGSAGPAAVALLNLALLLPTAQALLVGALSTAADREGGFVPMVRVGGARPWVIVAAYWGAVSVTAGLALVLGFSLSTLVLAATVPLADLVRLGGILVAAAAAAGAAAAIGVLIGSWTDSRLQAALVAVAAWFVLAMGLDLLLIGTGVFVRVDPAVLVVAVVLNPMSAARLLGMLAFDADGGMLGSSGAFLVDELGVALAVLALVATLVAWTVVPLWVAARARP